MKIAEQIALKSLLNAYLKSNDNHIIYTKDNKNFIDIRLSFFNAVLIVELEYLSLIGRHQFKFPLNISHEGSSKPVSFSSAIIALVYELSACDGIEYKDNVFESIYQLLSDCSNTKIHKNIIKMLHQIKNSHKNLNLTFDTLTPQQINELFSLNVDFKLTEGALLSGHQMHPSPKSCNGFNDQEFMIYYPELRNQFQMHYFIAKSTHVYTEHALNGNTNSLIEKYFLKEHGIDNLTNKVLIPVHPWQAIYLQSLEPIQRLLKDGGLIDLGLAGEYFTATSSVRTVYSENVPYMLKLSLNVMITNSVRMQYKRELDRAISVSKFWQGMIAQDLYKNFPVFIPITDPAFICLHENGQMIEESAVLFRTNPFMNNNNNAGCLASFCQDNPIKPGNRFNQIIPHLAKIQGVTESIAGLIWFNQFLEVCIAPLLWLFTHYEIALEAHQQNLLVGLNEDGLPEVSYYRDSQGYYISHEALKFVDNDNKIFNDFVIGSSDFIGHHFTYYLVCNSVYGIINAIGYSGMVKEQELICAFQYFIQDKNQRWANKINNYLETLLHSPTLPFKDNLATRLNDLDELTASIEQQSIYIDIKNPFQVS